MWRRLLSVSILLAATGVAVAPAAAALDPTSAFTVEGAAGSTLLADGTEVLDANDGSGTAFTAAVGATGTLDFSATGPVSWTVSVVPPDGGPALAAGQSYDTLGVPDADHAGLLVTGGGHSCAAPTGHVAIEALDADPNGVVSTLAASYSIVCAPGESAVAGTLRYLSDVPYPAAVRSPTAVDFGSVRVGGVSSSTVRLLSVGTDPLTPGVASIDGPDAADFTVGTDGCQGTVLGSGASCTVTVTAAPVTGDAVGVARTASLLVPDGSTDLAVRTIPLTVTPQIDAAGRFFPLTPARLLDTRTGFGTAGPGRVLTGQTLTLAVAGHGGVPAAGVAAVVLNVTSVGATSGGFVTVYPGGTDRPGASSLNVDPGRIRANSVTATLGGDGTIALYVQIASTDLVVDVTGYYATSAVSGDPTVPGSTFVGVTPRRLLDTRSQAQGPALLPEQVAAIPVSVTTDVPADVTALVVNVTAVAPSGSGFLATWSGVGSTSTSTLNFTPDTVTPNLAVVPTSLTTIDGHDYAQIAVKNRSTGTAHVVVDLFGYYTRNTSSPLGSLFHAIAPDRIADTRSGLGIADALGNGGSADLVVPASTGLPSSADAVVLNATAVAPTNGTFVTVWPGGTTLPTVSNLNVAPGDVVANAVMVGIDANQTMSLYNLAGTTDVVVDLAGWFEPADPAAAGGAPRPTVVTAAPQRRTG